jgi:hypothetical protein
LKQSQSRSGGPAAFDVVASIAGHDTAKLYLVLRAEGARVLLVNGKTRKLANPKVKSFRHVRPVGAASASLIDALLTGTATDRRIRAELARLSGEVSQREEDHACQKTM